MKTLAGQWRRLAGRTASPLLCIRIAEWLEEVAKQQEKADGSLQTEGR